MIGGICDITNSLLFYVNIWFDSGLVNFTLLSLNLQGSGEKQHIWEDYPVFPEYIENNQ
jgi:hypothetical protein